jgi:carbamoyl-phosphate synthase small subunit
MKYQNLKDAVLILEDGKILKGKAAGKLGTVTGEICFNTGMTGYQEIFTDPSYFGQVVIMTNVHIGNYGVNDDEVESDGVKISGLVCNRFEDFHSRSRSHGSLDDYFKKNNIVAIQDIDTRALVKYIRKKGVMNVIISSDYDSIEDLQLQLSKVPSMAGLELSSKVSCTEAYEVGDESSEIKVALLDLGVKKNIVRCLVERGCRVKVFPMKSTLDEMLAFEPNGFLISNGPGDPSVMLEEVKLIGEIIKTNIPVFGICLGHQLISMYYGLSTYKMFYGHRGINHPIKNIETNICEITSQNHGFVVDLKSAQESDKVTVTHIHLNDNTLAGIKSKDGLVFSVQYHPEAAPGPLDSRYLFDNFINNIKNQNILV